MKGTLSFMHKKGKIQGGIWFHGRVHFSLSALITLAIFIRLRKIRHQNLS